MMKQLLLTICLIVAVRSQINLNVKDYNKTWIYMPDDDGNPQVAYLVEPSPENRNVTRHNTHIKSKTNGHPKPLVADYELDDDENSRKNRDSLIKLTQKFNPEWDTKILVHGWWSDIKSDSVQLIRDKYAERGQLNIFAINWSEHASYLHPVDSAKLAGLVVAVFIDILVEVRKADRKRIHLIGHDLGAHVMGFAGSYTKYPVGRITGLDPVSLLFENVVGPENHLDRTDADLVDVIHTATRSHGFITPIGHADFYPNYGYRQRGCLQNDEEIFKINQCDHMRSYEYYAESIYSPRGFQATGCKDFEQLYRLTCNGPKVLMGDPMPTTARGIYYLNISDEA